MGTHPIFESDFDCLTELISKLYCMKELDVWGLKVRFPFDPYPSQVTYIQKCIEALKGGQNAILESPTGTGKTLCLLTAVLSFRQDLINEMKSQIQSNSANVLGGGHMG